MTAATFRRWADALGTGRIPAVVDVAIIPAFPEAPLAPVVEVELVPRIENIQTPDNFNLAEGAACSSACGYCGRCSCGQHGNVRCADCGDQYVKGEFDSDSFCDGCRAQRDAHTDALELRMAKAGLLATVKREVA